MKTATRLMLAASALALTACAQLPGSSLGATFTAERYLEEDHGGPGFNGALAREYTELARRVAYEDVRWRKATAYIAKAQAAEAGNTPAPWTPAQMGVSGEAVAMYDEVVATINANASVRPEACARAQAMWDQYLEVLRAGPEAACIAEEDARAMLDEALAECAGPGVTPSSQFIVYFGFDRSDLTDQAMATINDAVSAAAAMGAQALSVVGHADRSGSVAYNQGLSERRARRVAGALSDRGIPPGAMTLAGRSELDPAVPTADGVREPLNRRVEITLSQ